VTVLDRFSDREIVARTVYGEARGEGPVGQAAVTWVIRNRADHPSWYGRSLREVCLKGTPGGQHQFDCWDDNDPNRAKILALSSDDPALQGIQAIVDDVLAGKIPDPTGGAIYYHTKAVTTRFDATRVQTAEIGHQVFFKEIA
jgi:N-acetylmuramoyl-L-alanine amidase